jgi:hypothetical protein
MNSAPELGLVTSNSYPSGTGSYSYDGEFNVVVENLAYIKEVAIFAELGPTWKAVDAEYRQGLPGNRELWVAPASNGEGQFVVRYSVNGATYWDNNAGNNYKFPQAFDDFLALTGRNYRVIMANAGLSGGTMKVVIGVHNLAYLKTVGVVYSTDNWQTVHTAYATYARTMSSGLEIWNADANVGSASEVILAVFYRVSGNEYWDNNFTRNYKVTPTKPQKWAEAP